MASPTFSLPEFSADVYRWRPTEGKILATVFSQTFPLGNGSDNPSLWKVTEEDQAHGNMDVDAKELRSLFSKRELFPVPVDFVYKPALSLEEARAYLRSIDKETYDCFFFAFLTYTQPENTGTNFSDERLHFNDTKFDRGVVPLTEILDEVKNIKVAIGKPKVFLIQSDDVSFLDEKQYLKGPTVVADVMKMKIPQDADRLIIKSTIPQLIANLVPGKKRERRADIKTPSFLVQAFVDAVSGNANTKPDLLTLTTDINGRVARMIAESNHFRKGDMYVPLTTSTFTKLLTLGKMRE